MAYMIVSLDTQGAQYGFIEEYTSNYVTDPYIV